MKFSFINIILISFNSCISSPSFYEGYIYSKDKKPLENIQVCEQNKSNCTYTDKKGFFKLKKDENMISDLIIFNNSKSLDTIKTVWSQHGEKINYSFLEGKKDTLFVHLK